MLEISTRYGTVFRTEKFKYLVESLTENATRSCRGDTAFRLCFKQKPCGDRGKAKGVPGDERIHITLEVKQGALRVVTTGFGQHEKEKTAAYGHSKILGTERLANRILIV